MSGKEWTRTDKIGLISLTIAFVALISAILLPELRRFIGLEKSAPSEVFPVKQSSPTLPSPIATPYKTDSKVEDASKNERETNKTVQTAEYEDFFRLEAIEWQSKMKLLTKVAMPFSGYIDDKTIDKPDPLYPDGVTKTRSLNQIYVDVVVDEDGNVILTQANIGAYSPSDYPFIKAAIEAARKAKFRKPAPVGEQSKMYGTLRYAPPK
ncbi:MAG: hypothetical protein JOZ02_23905 [Acidobacteria bacterium]|nr:hypothetical protein [Acidobacteriota bacterium]